MIENFNLFFKKGNPLNVRQYSKKGCKRSASQHSFLRCLSLFDLITAYSSGAFSLRRPIFFVLPRNSKKNSSHQTTLLCINALLCCCQTNALIATCYQDVPDRTHFFLFLLIFVCCLVRGEQSHALYPLEMRHSVSPQHQNVNRAVYHYQYRAEPGRHREQQVPYSPVAKRGVGLFQGMQKIRLKPGRYGDK